MLVALGSLVGDDAETYNLIWPGLGVVGTTPRVWLGAVVGVAVPIL